MENNIDYIENDKDGVLHNKSDLLSITILKNHIDLAKVLIEKSIFMLDHSQKCNALQINKCICGVDSYKKAAKCFLDEI